MLFFSEQIIFTFKTLHPLHKLLHASYLEEMLWFVIGHLDIH